MSLVTPDKIQTLQRKLYLKAKREKTYRFYALYDKIYRKDILAHAYAQCRSNKGAPGVDGQDFADIEAYGVQRRSANWRLRSGRRLTDRSRSDECLSRRPTASFGRWASRPCAIGCA